MPDHAPPDEAADPPVGCSAKLWGAAIQALDRIYPDRGLGDAEVPAVNSFTAHLAAAERLYKALPKVPAAKRKRN